MVRETPIKMASSRRFSLVSPHVVITNYLMVKNSLSICRAICNSNSQQSVVRVRVLGFRVRVCADMYMSLSICVYASQLIH